MKKGQIEPFGMEFEFEVTSNCYRVEDEQTVNDVPELEVDEVKEELTRDEYATDLRLMLLRRRFEKVEEDQTEDDDNMLEGHELFYGLRLAKS